MDGKHRYRGLTIDEVKRMTAQGLRISHRDPQYMMCSVCTKSGLMLDFLSLDKIKSHYNEGGFHDILDSCRISRLSGTIDDSLPDSSEMADIDNFHIKKTDPECIHQHLSFVGRGRQVPTHVKTLKTEPDDEELSQLWSDVNRINHVGRIKLDLRFVSVTNIIFSSEIQSWFLAFADIGCAMGCPGGFG